MKLRCSSKTSNNLFSFLVLVCLLCLIPRSPASLLAQQVEGAPDLREGQFLYEKNCAHCHGAAGRGDGPVAPLLDPAPRDFTSAQFKIRSTPTGSLPTDQDLFNAITRGLAGTAMEDWGMLPEEERWQLVAYLKTFSPRFEEEKPQPIEFRQSGALGAEAIARGRVLYRTMKCFLCHGKEGKGDGPITVAMRSAWDMPFEARNLTRADRYKGGSSTEDIYRTISTGLAGTPMGSYADYMNSAERWHLAAYVESLQSPRRETAAVVLKSRYSAEEPPVDPDDSRWEEVEGFTIPLSAQVIAQPRLYNHHTDLVEVKSYSSDREIAFLLQWDDRTETKEAVFQDGVALQFPTKTPEGPVKPHFFMGEPGKSVNLWQWEAGRDSLATELIASGFEAVEMQPDTSQQVKAMARWKAGRWKVVLRRPLRTADPVDAQFEKGRLIPMAFSAWDGANREIGLRRSLSSWYYLTLETSRPIRVYLGALLGVLAAINLQLWLIRKARRTSAAKNQTRSVPADQPG